MPVMRVRRSASCLALSALTFARREMRERHCRGSRDAAARSPPRPARATCEWMSMVVDFGRHFAAGLALLARGGRAIAIGVGHSLFLRVPVSVCLKDTSRQMAPTRRNALLSIKTLPMIRLSRLGGGAGEHDRAGIDDHDVVGKVERQLDVLLDQHDRQPFGLQLRDGAADFGDDLRREAFGRLVHQQHARIAHQARGRWRASAARRRTASPRSARDAPSGAGTARTRAPASRRCRHRRRVCAATARFSRTVSERNTRRPCGTRQMPLRAIVSGARPATGSPNRLIAPRRGRRKPMMVAMQVVLPAPLRPSRPSRRAGLQREADAVQHVAVAVIGIDVADAQRLTRQGTPPWCADRPRLRRACLRRSPRRNAAA